MRVLIFHGYLLRGTGSNVYTAELARALTAAGHDVDLICQERAARDLPWVDAFGTWDNTGALNVEQLAREHEAGTGRCTVYTPPIADQLPVYVQDNYEGFTARTFDQFDEEELEFYVARNVMAVRAVVQRAKPDFALANHMVMGPYILSEALAGELPYVVKIHGSAMEYIVRPHERFLPYARKGVGGAEAVLVGSRHIAARTWDTLKIEGLERRIFLGPPGVDIERFRPEARRSARAGLSEVGDELLALPRDGFGPLQRRDTSALLERVRTAARVDGMMGYDELASAIAEQQKGYTVDGVDSDAGERLRALAAVLGMIEDVPLALYVGKLIVSKGVDLLIAAWPLVLRDTPDARLLITGFGAAREQLELLVDALTAGDIKTARWIAQGGRALEGGQVETLTILDGFLAGLEGEQLQQYTDAAAGLRRSIDFIGRLEHDLLARVVPAADCQLVPSTFPEAFGMVAAEAAACGVPPISADHSGLAEVTEQLQEHLSGVAGSMLSFRIGPTSIQQLAARMHSAFTMQPDQRKELSARLVQTAERQFSWAQVAETLIAAATSDTGRLRRP